MNYFTKTLLKNESEPIFSENDNYQTIETIDTILEYRIENGFCFLKKYRKQDGTFLTSLAYRIPESVCNPLLGCIYAENTDEKTIEAILSSTVFQGQVLPTKFMDAEVFPAFSSASPIKAHVSMIADRMRVLPQSDEGLFVQGFFNSYLDAPLLKREGSAIIATGYNRSYGEFRDEKHISHTIKEATVYAKVLKQETISINESSYTSLTVKTPFCGNAEIIIDKINIPIVNLVDTVSEFHIIETTASFLPIAVTDKHLTYNFDDALNLICKYFKGNSDFSALEILFDDSVVVYKDLLKVANQKDTAIEFLKMKRTMYRNNDYKITPAINTVTKVVIDDYDSDAFMCSMLKSKEVRKQLSYWKGILENHGDRTLDDLKISLDPSTYNKFLNQYCILFLEKHPFASTLSINEAMFITTGENNRITEMYFVGMPVFYNSLKGHEYTSHLNSIPITLSRGSSYVEVSSRFSYKKTIDYLEMMVQDPKYSGYDEKLLDGIRVLIHSLFENLKSSISEEEFEEKTIGLTYRPKSLRFTFTSDDVPSLSYFMEALFETCYTIGLDIGNDIKALYRTDIKKATERIKSRTFASFEEESLKYFAFDPKVHEMFSLTLAHYSEQNLSKDEGSESLAYILLLSGILDLRERVEEFT